MLANQHLRHALFIGIGHIDFMSIQKEHHIGILLDRAGVAQIGEHRALLVAPFTFSGELRQHEDWNIEFFGQQLELS